MVSLQTLQTFIELEPFLDEGSPFLEVPAERGVGIPLGSMEGIPMFCLNIKKNLPNSPKRQHFP